MGAVVVVTCYTDTDKTLTPLPAATTNQVKFKVGEKTLSGGVWSQLNGQFSVRVPLSTIQREFSQQIRTCTSFGRRSGTVVSVTPIVAATP